MPPAASGNARKASAGLFPLPRGHFGHGYVSPEQATAFRDLANQRVGAALAAERALMPAPGSDQQGPPRLSVARWKRVTSKLDMHIYRRRRRGRSLKALAREEDHEDIMRAVAGGQPSMIGIGRVEGSLEDLLYGWYSSTHEETQASMSLMDKHVQDSTVIATIETAATPTYMSPGRGEDATAKKKHPMQYIGIKWIYTKLPAALILSPRDWCFLQAMGVSTDQDGRRFGYCVLHSVKFPACPPFDVATTGVVRGEMYQTFILRENAPGFVDVFSRGVYDPSGVATPKFAAFAVAGALTGIVSSFRCAEAKKLTLLALRSRSTADNDQQVMDRCSVCYKRAGAVVGTMRWKQCRICGVTVCSKCYAKKSIFTQRCRASTDTAADGEREITLRAEVVECCTTCMIAAKNMTDIRPAEPEFSIVEGARGGALCLTPLLGRSVTSSAASSSGSDLGGKSSTLSIAAGISSVDLSDTGKTVSVTDDRDPDDGEEQVEDAILYTSDDFDSELDNGDDDEGEDVDIDDAAEVAAMIARMEKQKLQRSGRRGAKDAPKVDERFEEDGDLRNFGSTSKSVDGVNLSASMRVGSSMSQQRRRPRARPASASNIGGSGSSKISIDIDPAILSASSANVGGGKSNRTSSNTSRSSGASDSTSASTGGENGDGAPGRVNHQIYLLERMVALHNKAEEVYDLTRANQEMMIRSMGPK